MLWVVLIVVLAIVLIRFRQWFQTPAGRLVLDLCGLAIVIGLYLMHGVKGSIMYIEILIGLAAIYDAILQIKALNQPKK